MYCSAFTLQWQPIVHINMHLIESRDFRELHKNTLHFSFWGGKYKPSIFYGNKKGTIVIYWCTFPVCFTRNCWGAVQYAVCWDCSFVFESIAQSSTPMDVVERKAGLSLYKEILPLQIKYDISQITPFIHYSPCHLWGWPKDALSLVWAYHVQGDGKKSGGTSLPFWMGWNSAFYSASSSLLSQRSLLLTLGHRWLSIPLHCMASLSLSTFIEMEHRTRCYSRENQCSTYQGYMAEVIWKYLSPIRMHERLL